MDNVTHLISLLWPVILLEVILAIIALVHVLRHKEYRFGNRIFWILVVVIFQIVGPVIYLAFGRKD